MRVKVGDLVESGGQVAIVIPAPEMDDKLSVPLPGKCLYCGAPVRSGLIFPACTACIKQQGEGTRGREPVRAGVRGWLLADRANEGAIGMTSMDQATRSALDFQLEKAKRLVERYEGEWIDYYNVPSHWLSMNVYDADGFWIENCLGCNTLTGRVAIGQLDEYGFLISDANGFIEQHVYFKAPLIFKHFTEAERKMPWPELLASRIARGKAVPIWRGVFPPDSETGL